MLLSQNFRREFRQVISHCGSYRKQLHLENRLSRLTFKFSKRKWDTYRNGSLKFFRKVGSYKVGTPHDVESEEKDEVHGLNMRNWSPTEENIRTLEKLDDYVL